MRLHVPVAALLLIASACDSSPSVLEGETAAPSEITYRITSSTPQELESVWYTTSLNQPVRQDINLLTPWEVSVPDFEGLKAVQFATRTATDTVRVAILRDGEYLQETALPPTDTGHMYHGTFAGLRVYPLAGIIDSAGDGDLLVEVNGSPRFANPWPGRVHSEVNFVLFAGDTIRIARLKESYSILEIHTLLTGSAMHLATINHDQGPWQATWTFSDKY